MKRKQRGFTLVELMVVIVLIGLLAGVVGTKVIPIIFKGKKTTARAQMKTFAEAIRMYYLEFSQYPETLDDLVQPAEGWPNGFLDSKQVPLDPWGEEYVYDRSGGDPYLLFSKGPDKLEGTDDDVSLEVERPGSSPGSR